MANHVLSHFSETSINKDFHQSCREIQAHLEILKLCWNQDLKPSKNFKNFNL